ncbi:MAG TPA: hypothetical protein VIY29_12845, partial [Ktedonobacteraceae bacterium]
AVPRDISLTDLVDDMKSVQGVKDVHDLHVWSIASGMYALSCHVLINDLPPSGSSPILQSLSTMLNDMHHIGHATIQFECSDQREACCEIDGLYCRMESAKENPHNGQHHESGVISMSTRNP